MASERSCYLMAMQRTSRMRKWIRFQDASCRFRKKVQHYLNQFVRIKALMGLTNKTNINKPVILMSYKKLDIWKLSREIVIRVHEMLMKLPKFELYETGSQIRRSSKSIRSNIVEGYGRRRYKQDFIRFLIYAHSSVDETRDHLEVLYETKSLTEDEVFSKLSERLNILGKKLYKFIQPVENTHKSKS